MAEHGFGHMTHVIHADIEASTGDGACLGAQNEVLGRTGTGAPCEPIVNEIWRLGLMWARGAREVHCVIDDMVGYGHLPYDFLDGQNVGRRQDGCEVLGDLSGGGVANVALKDDALSVAFVPAEPRAKPVSTNDEDVDE